jgi:hypothetical protein
MFPFYQVPPQRSISISPLICVKYVFSQDFFVNKSQLLRAGQLWPASVGDVDGHIHLASSWSRELINKINIMI